MGDIFQFEWVRSLQGELTGPVLEIGSKRYGGPPVFFDYRTLFPKGFYYLGVDVEAGEGVDLMLDMSSESAGIRAQLDGRTFNTIICLSVLEHVRDVFAFARNVSEILNDHGALVLSVPFAWGVHAYPDDYWRFTPNAVRYLFSGLQFDNKNSWLHTISGRKLRLDSSEDYNSFIFPPGMSKSEYGGFPWLLEDSMFDMVGRKASTWMLSIGADSQSGGSR
jgi:hypothetical protein